MHGPSCIVWANLTPFSLLRPQATLATVAEVGLYPIVTLEKQLLNMIGNLV
jgi:hypothetical protein